MKKTTFKNKEVIKTLNESFWFIELNAEEKRTIRFNGQSYSFKPTGNNIGIHELGERLGSIEDRISFPTICFLNPDRNILFKYDQFISASNLVKLIEETKRKPE